MILKEKIKEGSVKEKIEDERKFRVIRCSLEGLGKGKEIVQGYLCVDPPIRVRVENNKVSFLTIKIEKKPGVNREFEEKISLRLARAMLARQKYHIIKKTRYKISSVEIDIFHEALEGLILIEFEQFFPGERFRMPDNFITEEVTGDKRFSNHNLCQLDKIPEEWRCQIVPRSL